MTYTERAIQLRPVIEQAAQSLDDAIAITAKELYPKWEDLLDENHKDHKVTKGFKFRHGDKLHKTEQPEYTFTDTYVPGSVGTESLFSVIDETHAGTIDNPIPYEGNMALEEGKYYSQGCITYYCFRDTINPVYHALSDLVGTYVEVA